MSESPIDRLFQQARALSGSERDAFLNALMMNSATPGQISFSS